jgi:hypothetical protein
MCCIEHDVIERRPYDGVMKNLLTTLALATLVFGHAITANAQVSFGIHIGEPPAPRAYVVPARPGADYVWIEGYQYPQGNHYRWHDGYWTRPPYQGAYWSAPYHSGGQYYAGRWEGSRGAINHNHRWDRGKDRDENRGRNRDENRRR